MKQTIKAGFFFVMLFFGCVQAKNRGSQNLGNSCYFNATIQAFSHIETLNDLLKKYRGSLESFPACYLEVIEELKKTTDPTAIRPVTLYEMTMRDFFKKPGQYKQEDAGELMTFLLSSIITNPNIKKEFMDIFGIEYTNTIESQECSHASNTIDSKTHFISVALRKDEPLLDIFKSNFGIEVLDGNEKWKCEKCGSKMVRATKRLWPSKLPLVFVIQLKRFDFGKGASVGTKLSYAVAFPLRMVIEQKEYELRSFIVHNGDVGGGHYWAYGRDFDSHWYRYDDGSDPVESTLAVKNITESGLDISGTPYILIYELTKLGNLRRSLELLREKLGLLSEKLRKLKTPRLTTTT